jgi:hypothetical protein
MTAARRRAIDHLRRKQRIEGKHGDRAQLGRLEEARAEFERAGLGAATMMR